MTDDLTGRLAIRDQLDAGHPPHDGAIADASRRHPAHITSPTSIDQVRDWWDGRPLWSPPRMPDEFVAVLWAEIDRLREKHADSITIPKPAIHTGPKHLTVDQATAQYLREVADRVRAHRYWGSGVTALVASVVENVAHAIELRCACGTDATSLNPAEVVVHRPDGCYIANAALATPTTTERSEGCRPCATEHPDHGCADVRCSHNCEAEVNRC